MPDRVLLEEFHLTLTVSANIPDDVQAALRRAINARAFRTAVRRAIVQVFRTVPALGRVRLTLSNCGVTAGLASSASQRSAAYPFNVIAGAGT